jgi:hypothetical protein
VDSDREERSLVPGNARRHVRRPLENPFRIFLHLSCASGVTLFRVNEATTYDGSLRAVVPVV